MIYNRKLVGKHKATKNRNHDAMDPLMRKAGAHARRLKPDRNGFKADLERDLEEFTGSASDLLRHY